MRLGVTDRNPSGLVAEADAWFTPGRFALMLAGLIFAAYPEVILGRQTFFFRDFGYFGYPLAHHHRESFWRGEIPLWNPLNNCGLPFLAQWNTLVLYPGSLFYLLFPLSWSLGVYGLGHQLWAGVGMYGLARRWTNNGVAAAVAGVAYAFNGLMVNCLMWPNNIAALAWMPWVVWSAQAGWRAGGRKVWRAGLVGAMQMLTGAPEIIGLTWLLVAALGMRFLIFEKPRRRGTLLGLVGLPVLVASLAAAQLFPFLDLLRHSQRDLNFANAEWSMPSTGWANLLIPWFRCFTKHFGVIAQYGQYWTSSYYLGVGTLALALFAAVHVHERRVRWLVALTILSLVFALGDNGYLYGWIRKAVPQFGFMRFPIKFVVLAVFCVPLLAACAVRWLQEMPPDQSRRAWRAILILSGTLVLLMAGILAFDYRYPVFQQYWPATWRSGWSRAGFLAVILAALYATRFVERRVVALLTRISLVLLIALDGLTHLPQQNPAISRTAFEPGLLQLMPRPTHGAARAMITPAAEFTLHRFSMSDPFQDYLCSRLGLFVNCNLLDGIPKVDGVYSLYPREMEKVRLSILYATTNVNDQLSSLYDFLGIAQMTAPGKIFDWAARPSFMPLITAGQIPVFADDLTVLRALAGTNFLPRQVVYLPPQARLLVGVTNAAEVKITTRVFSDHSVELDVVAGHASFVTVAQAFYPQWRAYVDGQPMPLWRANYAFQGFVVPAGTHHVRLAYEDRPFRLGAAISALALSGVGIGWIWPRRIKRVEGGRQTAPGVIN